MKVQDRAYRLTFRQRRRVTFTNRRLSEGLRGGTGGGTGGGLIVTLTEGKFIWVILN